MELCAGGDLLNYVRRRGTLTEDVSREIFSQQQLLSTTVIEKGLYIET